MPLSELEARRTLDPEIFGAHYQQAPIPPGGIIIRREWVRYYEILPVQNSSSVVLQSWDPASKEGASNDWSVCTTWLIQDGNYYLMHVLRERLDFHLCGTAP
jgi:phage terminase large subunit-like protein